MEIQKKPYCSFVQCFKEFQYLITFQLKQKVPLLVIILMKRSKLLRVSSTEMKYCLFQHIVLKGQYLTLLYAFLNMHNAPFVIQILGLFKGGGTRTQMREHELTR